MIVYEISLGVGLLFTIISAIAGHFFAGHDVGVHHDAVGAHGHADTGSSGDGVPGISFFSPTVMATFVTAFGAIGMILGQFDSSKAAWISAPVASIGGLILALIAMWLFNAIFHKTQSSSESRVSALLGHSAMTESPIAGTGAGQISYVHGGTRYTAPARSEHGDIPTGKTVKITRIVGTQFYVELVN